VKEKSSGKNPDPKVPVERYLLREKRQTGKPRTKKRGSKRGR
jgi:hypothetical protein